MPVTMRCDKVPSPPKTSQPNWAELHPELDAKSKICGRVEDTAIVKVYREDLAVIERAEKRKAEDVTAASLKELKLKSFLLILKFKLF